MEVRSAEQLVSEGIAAHGGASRWSALSGLEAEISAWGFLFTAKRRPQLAHTHVWASAHEPYFIFHDVPSPGLRSEWRGDEEVRIVDARGGVVRSRRSPRAAFSSPRRQFFWDALDFTYFAGYATWNYLTTPFLFLRPGFRFELLPAIQAPAPLQRVRAEFPPDVPTHSRTQTFYFDEQRRLRRLDYTAEVVGRWACAAHFCETYRSFDGFQFPTSRRVWPLLLGRRLVRFPTLVAIDVHNIRPVVRNDTIQPGRGTLSNQDAVHPPSIGRAS